MVITSLMIVAAVAVLAGIAAVSAGYGGELAPADPYRAGYELPHGRTLTSADLEQVRFSVGFWGYPPGQVEEVIDVVSRALAERDAHIADLELRLYARQPGGPGGSGGSGGSGGTRGTADGQGPRPGEPPSDSEEEAW